MSKLHDLTWMAVVVAAASLVSTSVMADPAPTRNERAQAGKLLRMPDIDFRFQAKPISSSQPGEFVKNGNVFARFDVTTDKTARLKVDTIPRRGSYPQSVPTGTVLFQVQVDNGVAFCTPMQPDQGVRRAQCFRDLNDDGNFDAGYVTEDVRLGRTIYGGRLQGLAPIPPTPYELGPGDLMPAEPLDVVLRNSFANTVYFDYRLKGAKVASGQCTLGDDKVCEVFGTRYVVSIETGGVRVVNSLPREPS
ncbi:hypothetical protein PbB2_01274 [Candidatus Phycosocius bacilliformis]|uniref:Uncharacterized protein n=1 Tax=Candidatus Phycosocius bacilliformis TaxID=1445552 RepID=A0A2P2E958_9PROT|nr:hypothetical protein [Candidatus Phycosocius bacilliformis]GBF57606.1 hypothetical protein PbB2_01274 [Candidatus Phycosocius bacilliformis]